MGWVILAGLIGTYIFMIEENARETRKKVRVHAR